jgi:hypothetical protein
MVTMSTELKQEEVEQYLRTFSKGETPYNFGGLLRLVLAGVENLRENVADGDVLEYAHYITDRQAEFMRQLLDRRAESYQWYLNEITHSSKVLHGIS